MTFLEFRVESLPAQDNCQLPPANYQLGQWGQKAFMDAHKNGPRFHTLKKTNTKHNISV